MKLSILISSIILLLFLTTSGAHSNTDSLVFNAQFIGWTGMNFGNTSVQQAGGRFLPELFYQHPLRAKLKMDVDLALNAFTSIQLKKWNYSDDNSSLQLYRASVRLSSEQWELRAGLQKLSFGSATLLRPLMWFDSNDPRDPLNLTNGVYGLLGRYYFLNNGNIWAWGLVGNKDPRGWDAVPTLKKQPEYGGRVQWPFLHGEIGLTFNHRQPGTTKPYLPDQRTLFL